MGVGIHVIGDDCLVTDNTCVDNNQGIVVKTSGSRVEANSCVANKVGGFDIAGVRNIVVRNSSRGSFANTFFGSSQDVLGPSVAMGGGEIPINSPWANFSILDS